MGAVGGVGKHDVGGGGGEADGDHDHGGDPEHLTRC